MTHTCTTQLDLRNDVVLLRERANHGGKERARLRCTALHCTAGAQAESKPDQTRPDQSTSELGWMCLSGDVSFALLFSTVVRPPLFYSSPPIQRRLKVRGPPPNSPLPPIHPPILSIAPIASRNSRSRQCQCIVGVSVASANARASDPLFLASSTIQPAHVFGGGIYCFMPNASLLYHWPMPSPPPFTSLHIPSRTFQSHALFALLHYALLAIRAPLPTPLSTAQPPSQTKRIRFGSPSNQPARTSTSRHTPTNRCLSSSQKQREPETPT